MISRRRWLLMSMAFGSLSAFSWPVFAGSYLDRAALLIHEANVASEYLRKRLYDAELARIVQKASKARVQIAGEMLVPDEVIPAHPHLLLVLEQHERAANAAVQRTPKNFLRHLSQARDEEELFRRVLKSLGWELPRVD